MDSNTLRQQMQQFAGTNAPQEIEQTIKKAYEGPTKVLINEGQKAREAFYPEVFRAAQRYGTGAADMSPAARLSSMLADTERKGADYRRNLGLRDYYGTLTNDMVSKALQGYQMGYNQLKDLYGMTADQERFDWQKSEAQRQRDFQAQQNALNRAASRSAAAGTSSGIGAMLQKLLSSRRPDLSQFQAGGYDPTQGFNTISMGPRGAAVMIQNGKRVGGYGPLD